MSDQETIRDREQSNFSTNETCETCTALITQTETDFSHLWVVCDFCEKMSYHKIAKDNLNVCEYCESYNKMKSSERIDFLLDLDTWEPMDQQMRSVDPIRFDSLAPLDFDSLDPLEEPIDFDSLDPLEEPIDFDSLDPLEEPIDFDFLDDPEPVYPSDSEDSDSEDSETEDSKPEDHFLDDPEPVYPSDSEDSDSEDHFLDDPEPVYPSDSEDSDSEDSETEDSKPEDHFLDDPEPVYPSDSEDSDSEDHFLDDPEPVYPSDSEDSDSEDSETEDSKPEDHFLDDPEPVYPSDSEDSDSEDHFLDDPEPVYPSDSEDSDSEDSETEDSKPEDLSEEQKKNKAEIEAALRDLGICIDEDSDPEDLNEEQKKKKAEIEEGSALYSRNLGICMYIDKEKIPFQKARDSEYQGEGEPLVIDPEDDEIEVGILVEKKITKKDKRENIRSWLWILSQVFPEKEESEKEESEKEESEKEESEKEESEKEESEKEESEKEESEKEESEKEESEKEESEKEESEKEESEKEESEKEESEKEESEKEESYTDKKKRNERETGLSEAVETGTGKLNGIKIALGVMDFRFVGGSMGSVVGEKITRLIEHATKAFLPIIIVCASGGARMQEGSLSLMQMAKISSALSKYRDQKKKSNIKLFYIPILTTPTTGGVTASFGMLGDIIIAEPDAYIAFAGKRVIEEIFKIEVPEGSQEAEVLFEKGFLDLIVPRNLLKNLLTELLQFHSFHFDPTLLSPKLILQFLENSKFRTPCKGTWGKSNHYLLLKEE